MKKTTYTHHSNIILPVIAYRWSDAERTWLEAHGITPRTLIGKGQTFAKVSR